MKVNFADTPDSLFSPAPSGPYRAEIVKYDEKTTSSEAKKFPNAPALNWQLRIRGGEYDDKPLFWFTLIGPGDNQEPNAASEALVSLKQLLAAAGYDVSGDVEFDPDEVIGREVTANVGIREGQNSVRSLEPLDEATAMLP